jgi:FkbM family methyltransferase
MSTDYRVEKPGGLTELGRAALTVSCRDCDVIPKVANAGRVITDEAGAAWQVMHNGVLVSSGAYQGEYMAQIISELKGHHEPQEEFAFWQVLQRLNGSPSMMELGAWWGYYSLWFRHDFPSGRNILVEPDTQHLRVGQANFQKNAADATFVAAGCGLDGTFAFFDETLDAYREIETKSVTTICNEQNIASLDLLHIDIQGAELSALMGAEDLVTRKALRFVFVSTHHHRISEDPLTHQRCLQWLKDKGAYILCEHSVNESYSGDGLVVASFDPQDVGFTIEISHARQSRSLFRELEFDLAELKQEAVEREQQMRSCT